MTKIILKKSYKFNTNILLSTKLTNFPILDELDNWILYIKEENIILFGKITRGKPQPEPLVPLLTKSLFPKKFFLPHFANSPSYIP